MPEVGRLPPLGSLADVEPEACVQATLLALVATLVFYTGSWRVVATTCRARLSDPGTVVSSVQWSLVAAVEGAGHEARAVVFAASVVMFGMSRIAMARSVEGWVMGLLEARVIRLQVWVFFANMERSSCTLVDPKTIAFQAVITGIQNAVRSNHLVVAGGG